ncbi:hypothetical protein [Hymenobacter nivis]|uniref:Uncharacterized protein n=1 Tax=Hymenobacter nivis TaxID=1850093 RepID=A0A2Z3GQG0_9BACT|nr:hypothetical protein [Hymenobacter nivis]AWM34342.1 hypothetical protein DDQ68_17045 [Hymenobacter nivis]
MANALAVPLGPHLAHLTATWYQADPLPPGTSLGLWIAGRLAQGLGVRLARGKPSNAGLLLRHLKTLSWSGFGVRTHRAPPGPLLLVGTTIRPPKLAPWRRRFCKSGKQGPGVASGLFGFPGGNRG